MPHEFAGHYKTKHPQGTQPASHIAEALQTKVKDGRISCAAVHHIAQELSESPERVGQTADLLEFRINKCQLGLFGYGSKDNKVAPAKQVEPSLEKALQNALQDGNRLSCIAAWTIAETLDCKRKEVAAACEMLKIKICDCQIGAF
jgi:hypothetical protein